MAIMILATGCSATPPPAKPDGVEVSGKVILPNGSPLTAGILMLRPEAGLYGVTAQIRKDGSFELVDSEGTKSVVPGEYRVFVRFNSTDQKPLQAMVNKRYQSSEDG